MYKMLIVVFVVIGIVCVASIGVIFERRISKAEKVNEILLGQLEEKKFTILLKDGSVVNTKGIASNGEIINVLKEKGCIDDFYLGIMSTLSRVEIVDKRGNVKSYEGALVNFMDSTKIKYNWGRIDIGRNY